MPVGKSEMAGCSSDLLLLNSNSSLIFELGNLYDLQDKIKCALNMENRNAASDFLNVYSYKEIFKSLTSK